MLPWLDALQTAGMAALLIGATMLYVGAWLQNRRDARRAANTHTEQYEQFLRYLSMVREAHSGDRPATSPARIGPEGSVS